MVLDLKQDMKRVDEKFSETIKKVDKKFNELTKKGIKDLKGFSLKK